MLDQQRSHMAVTLAPKFARSLGQSALGVGNGWTVRVKAGGKRGQTHG